MKSDALTVLGKAHGNVDMSTRLLLDEPQSREDKDKIYSHKHLSSTMSNDYNKSTIHDSYQCLDSMLQSLLW